MAIALLFAITLALGITYISDKEGKSLLKRGDFPGFYVLADIKKSGQIEKLYDPEYQRDIENKYWPSFKGSFYMSAYPAYTASLLYPLAYFNPQTAQFIFSGFMICCFILTMHILSKLNPSLKEYLFPVTVLCLCFAPVFYSLFGAQNTGLSMLLYSAVIYFLNKPGRLPEFAAGMCAGLWLLKPQFALFMIALMLASRLWWSLFGATLIGIIFQILAAQDLGFFWFLNWLKTLQAFSAQNFISNAPQIVSISGTLRAVSDNPVLGLVGACISVLLAVFFLLKAWKIKRESLSGLFILFGPALVMLSPQTLFYDLGIAFVSIFAVLDFNKDKSYWVLIGLNLISAFVVLYRGSLPIPLFFLFAGYFWYQSQKKHPLYRAAD